MLQYELSHQHTRGPNSKSPLTPLPEKGNLPGNLIQKHKDLTMRTRPKPRLASLLAGRWRITSVLYTAVLLIKSCIHRHGINESIHWPNIWNLFTLIIKDAHYKRYPEHVVINGEKWLGQWFSRFFNNIIIYGLSKYKDVFTNMLPLYCKSLANNIAHHKVLK